MSFKLTVRLSGSHIAGLGILGGASEYKTFGGASVSTTELQVIVFRRYSDIRKKMYGVIYVR